MRQNQKSGRMTALFAVHICLNNCGSAFCVPFFSFICFDKRSVSGHAIKATGDDPSWKHSPI